MLHIFGLRFVSDAIDLDDPEQVHDAAEATAAFFSLEAPDTRAGRDQLSHALADWSPDVVRQFVDASDIDWRLDQQTTDQLRKIVQEIIGWLEEYERNPPVAST